MLNFVYVMVNVNNCIHHVEAFVYPRRQDVVLKQITKVTDVNTPKHSTSHLAMPICCHSSWSQPKRPQRKYSQAVRVLPGVFTTIFTTSSGQCQ